MDLLEDEPAARLKDRNLLADVLAQAAPQQSEAETKANVEQAVRDLFR